MVKVVSGLMGLVLTGFLLIIISCSTAPGSSSGSGGTSSVQSFLFILTAELFIVTQEIAGLYQAILTL